MSLKRYLRGYDKWTEVLRAQYNVPDDLLPLARQLIGEIPDDPDYLDPQPLNKDQVATLSESLDMVIDGSQYDYYLEAEEGWQKVGEMRDALLHT